MNVWEFLNGNKTYIVGTVLVLGGLAGMGTGYLTAPVGAQAVAMGLGMMGLRHAIAKMGSK